MGKIHPINLAGVDLNLLVGFEALLIERNVSRAARRIGLAQSSMSNALGRIRALFGDELFVRTPGGMQPTPRALALAGPVCEALRHIRDLLSAGSSFDPGIDRRLIRLGASDHADLTLLPGMVALLRREAPGIALSGRTVDRDAAVQQLDDGSLDFVAAAFGTPPKRIRSLPLYADRFVCLARHDHPLLQHGGLTLDRFLDLPHLVVSRGEGFDRVEAALAARRMRRREMVTVPVFALVPFVLQETDLISVVGRRIALRFARTMGLVAHELPLRIPPWTLNLYWSGHSEHDPAMIWFRDRFKELGALLDRRDTPVTVAS